MIPGDTLEPLCQYESVVGKSRARCTLLARYVILSPPLVYQRTPTPVYLEGEYLSKAQRAKRPTPTHCRAHAYLVCDLSPSASLSPF